MSKIFSQPSYHRLTMTPCRVKLCPLQDAKVMKATWSRLLINMHEHGNWWATDETTSHDHCSTEEEEAPNPGSPKTPLYKEKCFEKLRETRATIPNDINLFQTRKPKWPANDQGSAYADPWPSVNTHSSEVTAFEQSSLQQREQAADHNSSQDRLS